MGLKKWTPESMKDLRYVTWPAISEDGTCTAWVVYQGDLESGSFSSKIWMRRDGETICLSGADASEKQPYLLKDGMHMAYLSNVTGEYQLYLRNLLDGNTTKLSTLRHGVLRYTFSADETKIVLEATLWPKEEKELAFIEMTAEEKKEWEEELDWEPYEITDLTYKMDEWHGMRKGEFSHIAVIDRSTQKTSLIDTDGIEAVYPSWSADGTQLAFYGYPYQGAKGRDTELFTVSVSEQGVQTDAICQITKDAIISTDHMPYILADGSFLCMMYHLPEGGGAILLPALVSKDGSITFLAQEEDEKRIAHGVKPAVAGTLEYGDHTFYYSVDEAEGYLYYLSGYHGKNQIYRVKLKEGALPELVCMANDIHEFARSKNGHVATVQAEWKMPAELFLDGEKITDENAWLTEYELAEAEEFWVQSRDKKVWLQYFLVHPTGQKDTCLYPAVLDIKGGPDTMYSMTFWHEFQALASAGMAVIYANPRGSAGFGTGFSANGVCWKPEAMEDLLVCVEDAVKRGFIDETRIGVTGGSYGGYMTNKLIGRTKVFKAAVTQRCLANTATSYGTGDMGFVSAGEIPKHFRMLDYLEDRARGNIISYIDNFKVPLLILHAYEDYRCGFEQAEQVFIPMKERNPEIPVRLVMFPGENHGMTRTGKLYHQVRHLQEMTDWFVKYLEIEERME